MNLHIIDYMRPTIILLFLFPVYVTAQTFQFEESKTLEGHLANVEYVIFSPDKKQLISSDFNGKIIVWDIETKEPKHSIRAHTKAITQISFNNNGQLMCSSSWDGTIKLWNVNTFKLLKTIHSQMLNFNPITVQNNTAVISPDNRYIYFGNRSGGIYRSEIASDAPPEMLYLDKSWITDGIVSPDGQHYVFSSKLSTKFLNFKTDKIDKEIGMCQDFVNNLVFDPSNPNQLVSWCQNGSMNFWNVYKGELIASIQAGMNGGYSQVVFSDDGNYIISGNTLEASAKIWDAKSKQLIRELKGHNNLVRSFRFGPENKWIVTASYDGTLKIWEEPKPEIHFIAENIPETIENRRVVKVKDIIVSSPDLTLFVWDEAKLDGDTISMSINGDWLLDKYPVTHEKIILEVSLEAYTNNYLVLFANNLGTIPPNTAVVSFLSKKRKKRLLLTSDLKKCEAVNFIYRPKK